MSLSERLKQVRETFHINQTQLAKRIGVTSQLISLMETGKLPISDRTARTIEAEFGVNHDWLITGEGAMLAARKSESKSIELAPELQVALAYYPAVTNALNVFAQRMTLADWEALNDFLTRETEIKKEDG